ncbi:MAG: EamA family transporter [Gammaproteobacteria bacterium]
MTLTLILISVGLNALAQVLLRAGMKDAEFHWSFGWALGQALSPGVIGGLMCYGVSIVLWLAVLSRVQVSLAYPFQALGYVFASLVAWRFLGEGMGALNVLGLALICAGVVVLSRAS